MDVLSTPAMQLGGAAIGIVTWVLLWWLAGRMDRLIGLTMRIMLVLVVLVPVAWILIGRQAQREQSGGGEPDVSRLEMRAARNHAIVPGQFGKPAVMLFAHRSLDREPTRLA